MPQYEKVGYDIQSKIGSVAACLQGKKDAVGSIKGIGPNSCCSFISYLKNNGEAGRVLGNSRNKVLYKNSKVNAFATACAHGELTALWQIIEEEDCIPTILEMYIEMSPCDKCGLALANLLPQDLKVYYSFQHPNERGVWTQAANLLCG